MRPRATPPLPEEDLRRLRAPLLRWYRRHRRDLPWRRTRDPYAIWVSEVMLQQTRVAVVLNYYERFLRRFPDVAALARASEDEVLAAWSGLGYYRRAISLRRGAIAVTERSGGELPDDPAALIEIPGIGRYTAGAIASVAFGRDAPVLDGNVRRVLSRVSGFRPSGAADVERLWCAAAALARGASPGDVNQAMMELGARVCTPRSPDCPACPWRRPCRARASGEPESYQPPRRPATPPERVVVAVAVVRRGRSVLLERRDGRTPLRGRWDLPARTVPVGAAPDEAIRGALASRGIDADVKRPVATVPHAILDRRLELAICPARPRGRLGLSEDLRWADRGALDEVAVSGATRKVLRVLSESVVARRRPASTGVQKRSHGGSHPGSTRRVAGGGGGSSGRAKR